MSHPPSTPQPGQQTHGGLLAAVFIAIIAMFAIVWAALDSTTDLKDEDIATTISALFSALAFGGLLFALILQRQQLLAQQAELRVQVTELHETRLVMERQREQMELQNGVLLAQTFDAQFYQLVRALRDAAGRVTAWDPSSGWEAESAGHVEGGAAFTAIRLQLGMKFDAGAEFDGATIEDEADACLTSVVEQTSTGMQEYLEHFWLVAEYIERQRAAHDGHTPWRLLRAQMPVEEIRAMAFVLLCVHDRDAELRPLYKHVPELRTLSIGNLRNIKTVLRLRQAQFTRFPSDEPASEVNGEI